MNGKTRLLGFALLLSLGFNIFAAGYFLAQYRHGHLYFYGGRHSPMLPPELRRALHAAMMSRRPAVEAAEAEVRTRYLRIADTIERKPFNQAQLEKDGAALRAAYERMHRARQDAIFAEAGKMTPEERKALARAIRAMPRHLPHMMRGGRGEKDRGRD